LIGILLERATGHRYADFLSENLWRALNLADASLYLDREGGAPMVNCCILSRPIDWLRIGELIANRGVFEGVRLVSSSWIAEMLEPAPMRAGYGYLTWLGNQRIGGEPDSRPGPDTVAERAVPGRGHCLLHGHGGQRTWIIPSRRLVIVRAGRSWPLEWDEAAIPNAIIRAIDERAVD